MCQNLGSCQTTAGQHKSEIYNLQETTASAIPALYFSIESRDFYAWNF